MPRRRSRDEAGPSRPSPYDATRFVNEEAAKFFTEKNNQKCIPERGLEKFPPFKHIIETQHWSTLCTPIGEPVVPVVREFYANLKEYPDNDTVSVRGKTINIASTYINTMLGCAYRAPTEEADGLIQFTARARTDLDAVLLQIASPGAVWTELNGVKTSINRDFLPTHHGIWFRFIAANLMPTTTVSRITVDRAILLSAILTADFHFDVGRLIRRQMTHCATSSSVRGWYFPSLVTKLCSRAGVQMDSGEQRIPLPPAWDQESVRKFKVRGVRLPAQPPAQQQQEPPPPPRRRGQRPVQEDQSEQLARTEAAVHTLAEQHRDLRADCRRVWRFQRQAFTTIVDQLHTLGAAPSQPLPEFPVDLTSPARSGPLSPPSEAEDDVDSEATMEI